MSQHRVAVIMSAFNEEDVVARAIESILAQSFADFELLIANDGSSDKTEEVVRSYRDPRVKIFSHANRGLEASLNGLIAASSTPYIARMDADDVSRSDRLARQVDFLDKYSECGLVGSYCGLEQEESKVQHLFRVPIKDDAIRRRIVWENPFVHSSVMIRRSVLDLVGPYNPSFRWGDYELWCRMLPKCRAANIPAPLVKRIHRKSSTYRGNKCRHYREKLKVQFTSRLYFGLTLPLAASICSTSFAVSCHWLREHLVPMRGYNK